MTKNLWVLILFLTSLLGESLFANDSMITRFNSDVERLRRIGENAYKLGQAVTSEMQKPHPDQRLIARSTATIVTAMAKYDQLRGRLTERRDRVRTRGQNLKIKVSGVPQSMRLPPVARSLAESLKTNGLIDSRAMQRAKSLLPRSQIRGAPRTPLYKGPGSGGSFQ